MIKPFLSDIVCATDNVQWLNGLVNIFVWPCFRESDYMEWFLYITVALSQVLKVICIFVGSICINSLYNWLRKLAPCLIHWEGKPKPILWLACTHFRITSSLRGLHGIGFVFWLVYWAVHISCHWLEQLLWFWFHDNQLNTTLSLNFSVYLFVLNWLCFPACTRSVLEVAKWSIFVHYRKCLIYMWREAAKWSNMLFQQHVGQKCLTVAR